MVTLITGAAGFIGNHLCRYLIKSGIKVVGIDNFSSGLRTNISDLLTSPSFHFIETDVCDKDRIESLSEMFCNIEMIYHLACPASPKYYQSNPLKTIQTCINGTINILELAKKYNSKVLFTSTSEIYGDPTEHPQKETYRGNVNTLGIRACYDESKRLCETIMMEYNRLYNIDTKIVRIFNTYGPNMNPKDGRVVINFIQQSLSNESLTIYGTGEQTRCFCYISDMIDGLVKMMYSSDNGPINLGNPVEMTIKDLSTLIIKMTNSKSCVRYMELPQDDPVRRCPDINKAKKILEWEPQVDIRKGLELMIRSLTVK